jgi:hypothetical protein
MESTTHSVFHYMLLRETGCLKVLCKVFYVRTIAQVINCNGQCSTLGHVGYVHAVTLRKVFPYFNYSANNSFSYCQKYESL